MSKQQVFSTLPALPSSEYSWKWQAQVLIAVSLTFEEISDLLSMNKIKKV